jgi:hypothetical protein
MTSTMPDVLRFAGLAKARRMMVGSVENQGNKTEK